MYQVLLFLSWILMHAHASRSSHMEYERMGEPSERGSCQCILETYFVYIYLNNVCCCIEYVIMYVRRKHKNTCQF